MHLVKINGVPGIELEVKKFDFRKVVQDELALVETLRHEKYSKVLLGLEHVTFLEGRVKFVSSQEVEVNGETPRADVSAVNRMCAYNPRYFALSYGLL